MSEQHDFYALTPDTVLDAVESAGFEVSSSILALNSYENRVYQVAIEDKPPIIVKFYRPQRWSNEAIIEEHQYTQLLADHEIPVVAPLTNSDNTTLFEHKGYRFSAYPRKGGYAPEPGHFEQLEWIGRLLGRMHNIGRQSEFKYRPTLSLQTYCHDPAELLLKEGFIPEQHQQEYQELIQLIATKIQNAFDQCHNLELIRSHADCHIGNILWRDDTGPHFVDFDDCRMAPAIQDLWMLMAGNRQERTLQLDAILEEYSQFASFNNAELRLIEPLRTLRLIHYNGWLAKRWQDPAFPLTFHWFNTDNYWAQHIAELRDQLDAIDAEPLQRF